MRVLLNSSSSRKEELAPPAQEIVPNNDGHYVVLEGSEADTGLVFTGVSVRQGTDMYGFVREGFIDVFIGGRRRAALIIGDEARLLNTDSPPKRIDEQINMISATNMFPDGSRGVKFSFFVTAPDILLAVYEPTNRDIEKPDLTFTVET
jgi:hypothetical protein